MPRDEYERLKRRVQIELLKLQKHIRRTGDRHAIVFEGRDAAGKGGTIQRFMEHLNAQRTSRGAGEADRNRTNALVFPALHIPPTGPPARWCCSTGRGITVPTSRK
jgi:Polyphosphate kinase 2 (PPK2)